MLYSIRKDGIHDITCRSINHFRTARKDVRFMPGQSPEPGGAFTPAPSAHNA